MTVPTGNFGNILAAYYAKQMGIPIGKLICASNDNKVLYDFFRTGEYDRNRPFILTTSPSVSYTHLFKAIVAFRQDRPFQWEYLKDYLVILSLKPLFILSALATLLWLIPLLLIKKKKFWVSLNPDWKMIGRRDWIAVFWPYAALLGIYLYFIKIYRVLPIVVTACLLGTLILSLIHISTKDDVADLAAKYDEDSSNTGVDDELAALKAKLGK